MESVKGGEEAVLRKVQGDNGCVSLPRQGCCGGRGGEGGAGSEDYGYFMTVGVLRW